MEQQGERLVGTVPEAYTESAYPLMYFFAVRHRSGGQALCPGLAANLSNQPYFTLGSSASGRR